MQYTNKYMSEYVSAGNPENAQHPTNPVIVFLHGMGTGANAWRPQFDHLNKLDKNYFVIAPFLPGYSAETERFSFEATREGLKYI